MTGPRYTKLKANRILPEVRSHLEALRLAYGAIARHAVQMSQSSPNNGGDCRPAGWQEASEELARNLQWFSSAGIIVKNVERGLIDFPAIIDGREVLLCWEDGEDEVAFWHLPDAGFPGRRPL